MAHPLSLPCRAQSKAGRLMPDILPPLTKADLLPRLPSIFIDNVRREWSSGLFEALSTGIVAMQAMWKAAST